MTRGRLRAVAPGRPGVALYRSSRIGGVSGISGQATGRCIPAARPTRAASARLLQSSMSAAKRLRDGSGQAVSGGAVLRPRLRGFS